MYTWWQKEVSRVCTPSIDICGHCIWRGTRNVVYLLVGHRQSGPDLFCKSQYTLLLLHWRWNIKFTCAFCVELLKSILCGYLSLLYFHFVNVKVTKNKWCDSCSMKYMNLCPVQSVNIRAIPSALSIQNIQRNIMTGIP